MTRHNLWQRAHHMFGHPFVGLSNGALWAWKLHDWTWHKGWDPEYRGETTKTVERTGVKQMKIKTCPYCNGSGLGRTMISRLILPPTC